MQPIGVEKDYDDFELEPSNSFTNLINEIQFEEQLKRYKELYVQLCSENNQNDYPSEFHSYYNFITTVDFIDSVIVNDLKEYNKKLHLYIQNVKSNNSLLTQYTNIKTSCKRVLRQFLPM